MSVRSSEMGIPREFIAFLAFLTVFGHGYRIPSSEEFPFQVSIERAGDNTHLCGGVIITSKWILTVRECAKNSSSVLVSYGRSDSKDSSLKIMSKKIFLENEPVQPNKLALIELEREIFFSKTAKQARLPIKEAKFLSNSTKLSGWKLNSIGKKSRVLNVIDKYQMVSGTCKFPNGNLVPLEGDEFCGIDEEYEDYFSLTDLGTTVSKDGIALGLLAKDLHMLFPAVFSRVSKYEDWIKTTLGDDEKNVSWTDEIPRDSAESRAAANLALLAAAAFFFLPEIF